MDRTKRDLEALMTSQKDQLIRYEKRLKDVVTAYKGLLKEKEALETSLAAITNSQDTKHNNEDCNRNENEVTDTTAIQNLPLDASNSDDKNVLRIQISTLMNSLATLSAEKSRMEASFQADKKQLRSQISQKEEAMSELKQQLKEAEKQTKISIEEIKAKWLIERQEREQETNNQMLMIRELQKLYADERHLKENIEMQLNNFKMQFASDEAENTRLKELQLQLKDARAQLREMQQSRGGEQSGAEGGATNAALLKQVYLEMQQLKEQHALAIKSEQKRVLRAEEQSKQLASVHEERVANLEARLAELSTSVGSYDRLRQQDQRNIHELKQKLLDIERRDENVTENVIEKPKGFTRRSIGNNEDITEIIAEVERLKHLLLNKNSSSPNPVDVTKIFSAGTDHQGCQEELRHLHQQHEGAKNEVLQLHEKLQVQRNHIATLQEKVKVLNRNIDEQEQELKHRSDRQHQAVMDERAKWKVTLTEIENDCRSKLYEMEQQLQKQRQRSLQLLEEKEQEIKTLHTSFEVFHTTTSNSLPTTTSGIGSDAAAAIYAASSDGESVDGGVLAAGGSQSKMTLTVKSKKLSVGDSCHMLHYANEIARKDIEIAGLRKAKYAAETSLRKAIHEKVSVQQELSDTIDELEQQVDRLERCKTREGANLEYLKNVVISFILTKDAEDKQHMLNAISAVLQFTPAEIQTTNAAFLKK